MASDTPHPIVFVVPGAHAAADGAVRGAAAPAVPAGLARGRIKQSVRIAAQRGAGVETQVEAIPGEDVVVLHIADGPSLVLHPETARDLMLAQGEPKHDRGARGAPVVTDAVPVPVRLRWRGLEESLVTRGAARGALGDVIATGLDIVAGLVKDPAADLVATAVVRRVDAQVDPGVYRLDPATLSPLKGSGRKVEHVPAASGPILVLIHGTFVETTSTFGELWSRHPQLVRSLFEHYRDRVYALEHPTLGASPIANALTLVRALPDGACLHLVTHSRGGLVAEVLARVCAAPALAPEDLARFAGRSDARDLDALATLVAKKAIRVYRVVRVACPARGTLLASKRLDAYLSVFKWTLELAGVPIAPAFVDFLGEVALRRSDPALLPGLEAQIPDSALIQWLHDVDELVPGELKVVAGDIEGDSVTSWLKTLLADAFYWTDNDLVVHTRSMYGGAPRAAGATFLLARGGDVSHFTYFANELTAEAIVNALVQEVPAGFRTIGPLSWAGQSSTGYRARSRGDTAAASAKPAVFLLPGILGSNLKVDGKRIWLGWRLVNGLSRLEYAKVQPDGVEPDGPLENTYDELVAFLAATHDVIEFDFDWRRPLEVEARRLGTAVDKALALREANGQPVRLLAHSMGGLLARTMQLECPDVWTRMMARPGARVLMLGTPNGGSWAPMQVLSGDDTFGNLLVAFGAPFRDHAARKMMAGLPGFLQLQRGLGDRASGLDQQATWKRLADADLAQVQQYNAWHRDTLQLMPYKWGVPTQGVLDQAVALRRRLDAQVRDALPSFSDKVLLVAGKARLTPDGFEVNEEGLVYRDAVEGGDGRVTLESALLPGVATWQIDCEHGKLPQESTAFDGYLDLLRTGDTNRLPRLAVADTERGAPAPAHVPSRPSREQPLPTPPENAREVGAVGAAAARARVPKDVPLRVSVTNGDLMFVRQPMLVGHYRSSRLTGTERAVDRLVGGSMAASLRVGVYPEPIGSQEIFVNARRDPENPWRMPRPEAVIVVGLGEEGKLNAADLAFTVRQGVLEWARRLVESGAPPAQFEIAAALIGSGGTGVSPGQAAQLVARGVRDANAEIARENQRQETDRTGTPRAARIAWPRVARLDLIELYLDRAGEAWRALQVLASAAPGRYRVGDVVLSGVGGLERPPDSSYRGADYDFITAITRYAADGSQEVAYTMDTRRARSEVRAQKTQVALLREIVRDASNAGNRDPRIGRTLFQLLIPLELEPFLGGTTDMVLELDEGTAVIPWELLDTDSGARGATEQPPWAIRSKLLRKLRTERFRARVSDAGTDAYVLVIGEPRCDIARYPPLPGARAEAKAVCELLAGSAGLTADRVRKLVGPDGVENGGPDARAVIDALLARDWRIVHIAGHGQPPEIAPGAAAPDRNGPKGTPSPGGVVLSGGVFLGASEIRTMRIVPELVFINCCHLAAMDERRLLDPYDRPEFAATVARELIEIGVRCVIAAGWAVDDEPAKVFATAFYTALLSGRRFIDSVALAREAAWRRGGNTWAAYQCYGDPDWVLNREQGGGLHPPPTPAEEFGGINCAGALKLALDTIGVRSKFRHLESSEQANRDRHGQEQKIGYLETRFGSVWGGRGDVAEAFARASADTGDLGKAITWYERALRANDGTATLRASEQLGNLRVRLAESVVAAARRRRDELAQRAAPDKKAASGRKQKKGARGKAQAKPDRELGAAQAALEKVIRAAHEQIRDAIALLEQVRALRPTMERESLCASAHKRLALLAAEAGDVAAEASAIARMAAHYAEAEKLGREGGLTDAYYPALNRIAAEIVANAGRARWPGIATATIASVRSDLAARIRDDPDFWSVAGMTELDLYAALGKRNLARALPRLERDFDDLHNRVSAPWLWASVDDQAGFVLRKYAAGASQAERAAAASLLARLEAMARGR